MAAPHRRQVADRRRDSRRGLRRAGDHRPAEKALEAREDELKTQVMSAFGDAEEITYMGKKLATWKTRPPTASTPPG